MERRPPCSARALALVVSALLSSSTRSALADDPPSQPPAEPPPSEAKKKKDKELEVVVTGTRTPESSQRATVRTDVVTREEAARRGATNVGEALSGQPGVQVNPSAYGLLGNPSGIQIQGMDRDRVLILEDGERVIGDIGGVIDLAAIPLTDVDKIELVTGPTSSLYGANAIGGVVNVISAPPAHPGFSARGLVEGRYPWGGQVQGGVAYRRQDDWAELDASYLKTPSLRLDETVPDLTLPEMSRRLLGVRVGTRVGRQVDLRARVRWIHDEIDGLEQEIRPGLAPFLIDTPERADRVVLNAGETLSFGGGSNLRIAVGRQWAEESSVRDRRSSPVDDSHQRSGQLSSFEATATIVEGRRTWVGGFRAEVEDYEQNATIVDASPSGGIERRDLVEVVPTRLGGGALYAQLGWKLTDTLTVMPGVRGELHLRYGEIVVPRFAVAWRPAPIVILRASVGRGFRAPSAKELGFVFDHSVLGYRVLGNTALQPERSWGVNGDVSVNPGDFTVRAGGFANWIDQLIDVDQNNGVPGPGGVQEYTYKNVAKARTAGLSLDGSYRVTPRLRTEVGYAYLWTRDDTNERPLEGRPPHTVTAGIRADLFWRLELAAQYRAVTDAFLTDAPRAPGFQTVDFRLARPLWPGGLGYAGMKNVLGVQKDPNRLGDQRPIPGRVIYLGLSAEFPGDEQ